MRINPTIIFTISTLVTGIAAKLVWEGLVQSENYSFRPYLQYYSFNHPNNSESLICVEKNRDSSAGTDYVAILTANGQIRPLKNQFIPMVDDKDATHWSKDGSIVAFKRTLHVFDTTFIPWERGPYYTFAYDFSNGREICPPLPDPLLSKYIGRLMIRRGGVARKIRPACIVIGVEEQSKFERADVNRDVYND